MHVDTCDSAEQRQLQTNQGMAIGYGSCNRSAIVHGFRHCWIQEPDLQVSVTLLSFWLGFPPPQASVAASSL